MHKSAFFLLITTLLISPFAYSYDEDKLMAEVHKIYDNYRASQPICDYPEEPDILSYPEGSYTLTNPSPTSGTSSSLPFTIRSFSIEASDSPRPQCGKLSVECASIDSNNNPSAEFYCERLHNGLTSDDSLLGSPEYDKYLAYQTIYYKKAMPTAQKNFGSLEKPKPLDAFPFYSPSKPGTNYGYYAIAYTAFAQFYPNPSTPQSAPNYNNGNYALFLGSAKNFQSLCVDMKNKQLPIEDARIRINQFLGLPTDSPDVTRTLVVFQLRNNPHKPGLNDGNLFRPCPSGGNLYSGYCMVPAETVPHDCNIAPAPYDGVSVSSFLANQYYSSYCNSLPNAQSGSVTLYPWTGQGFTYDWNPWNTTNQAQGSSEYVGSSNMGNTDNMIVTKQIALVDFLSSCDFK